MHTLERDARRKAGSDCTQNRPGSAEDRREPRSPGEKAGVAAAPQPAEREDHPAPDLPASHGLPLSVRLVLSVLFLILLIWMETAALQSSFLPAFVRFRPDGRRFLAADTALLLLTALLCMPDLLQGVRSLVTFRADSRSLPAVAWIGALALDGYLLIFPDRLTAGGRMIDSAASAAVLTFYLMGKAVRKRAETHTLSALREGGRMDALRLVRVPDKTGDSRRAACPVRIGQPDIRKVREAGRALTPADAAARVLAPAVLAAGLALMGLGLWLRHGAYDAIASFAAVCVAGSPAAYGLCQALTQMKTARRLRRRHAALAGYAAVREFQDTDQIVVDAGMLFPPENALIHGIKAFSGSRIEEVVVDTASVVAAAGGPLAAAFRRLIADSSLPLRRPERITYREEQGICAVLGGKEVVAGSRDLLRLCGVAAPPREYEAKYVSLGRDLFYLAENGALKAMFIVEYRAGRRTHAAFRRLMRAGVSVRVRSSDPNITGSMIVERFGGDTRQIRVLGSSEAERISAAARAGGAPPVLFFDGSLRAYAGALLACLRLRRTARVLTAMQAAGAVLGVALAAWLGLTSGIRAMTPATMLEYQAVWALPALLVAAVRRN